MENLSEQNDKVFTVTQLTGLIKTLLENSFKFIQLKGEISNCKIQSSGHIYFVLKDSESQISAVMFRGRASTLDFEPKDGMMVQVWGGVSVYGPRGQYQFIVNKMTKAGIGDIMEMIEERKKKLAQEGLFDSINKKKLPFFPRTVGVVTSATGAALKDILQVGRRRNPKVSFLVLPAIVQGTEAAPSIIHQIKTANRYNLCDVLIVGRGGGSLEDLLPFSDENVVRAIAMSDIPVISAVGHEIDWSLADFAADVRAPTPSAACEIAVPLLQDIEYTIETAKNELFQDINRRLENLRLMMNQFNRDNMELQFRRIEHPLLMKFEEGKKDLLENMEEAIKSRKQKIDSSVNILNACNPQTIFDRGYSMVKDARTGKIIRSINDTQTGAEIEITPAQGKIRATVTGGNCGN